MKVVVRIGGHERDLDVAAQHPDATLGDLLAAVTGRVSGGNLRVADRVLPARTLLVDAGLHEGVVLGPDPRGTPDRPGLPASGPGFARGPRPATPPPPAPVPLPVRAGEPEQVRVHRGLVLGPLLLGLAAVGLTGDPLLGAVGLLSPTLGAGTFLEQRRRARRRSRDAGRTATEALAALDAALDAAAAAELARLRELAPDPTALVQRAASRLWERRPGDADFLVLHAGVADLPWDPPVSGTGPVPPGTEAVLARPRLRAAPVAVRLGPADPDEAPVGAVRVIGVVGDRAAALAAARSLLCQAAVQSGPADLTVAVLVDERRGADWDWARWLPHTRRGSGRDRWVSADRARTDALLARLPAEVDGALLLVLDAEDAPELLAGGGWGARAGRAVAVVLADRAEQLPVGCGTVLRVARDGVALVHGAGAEAGVRTAGVRATAVSAAQARACALDLARVQDPEQAGPGDGVRLLPLLDLGRVDADAVRRSWAGQRGLSAPLGTGPAGIVELDLLRDGPHALVSGPGAAAVLRALVVALAVRHDPTRLGLSLLGTGTGACARLPHATALAGPDGRLDDDALAALEAEVHRRERLPVTGPGAPPRLLVVVDDLARLAPQALGSLLTVAVVGAPLGVHLLLGAPGPGPVPDDVLAVVDVRLRLADPDPSDGPTPTGPRRPGRAELLRADDDEGTALRVAVADDVVSETEDGRVRVRPFTFGPPQRPRASSDRTDLERLVDAVAQAATDRR